MTASNPQSPPKDEELDLDGPDHLNDIKVDPAEAMRLNADKPSVIRLSRKAIAGIGLVAGLGVGTALIFALQPRDRDGHPLELHAGAGTAKADGLADLPADYTFTPKLGRPLPGDLGRPILNAERKAKPSETPTTGNEATQTEPSAEEQRRLQEMEAARLAQLFVPTSTRPISSGTSTQLSPSRPSSGDTFGQGTTSQNSSPQNSSPQDKQQAFLDKPANKDIVSDERITPPPSPYLLQAGSVIPAALITGIRSDLPGQITAQVTQNVYDSPTGRLLLIPQGTRIIGQYDNGISFGQSRLLLVWNRLIYPDGRSIILAREPGADNEGQAGLQDQVDYHWGQMFKAAALSTLLAIGAEAGNSDADSDIVRALRQGASDSISDIGQQIVQRQLNIAPTLTIRPGFPVRVIITRDLVLEPTT